MTLSEKRRRRLMVFLVAALLLGALAAGGYAYRTRQLERRAIAGRDEGMRLLEAGDYYGAMHSIGPYSRRHPDDLEVLFSYALARENVPEPNNKHLSDAMGLYRRVLSLEPDHSRAAHRLLELYSRAGFATEALELSRRLLDLDPANKAALRAQVQILFRQRKFAEAEQAALRLSDLAPEDIEYQVVTLEVLQQQPGAEQRILERAGQLRERHGDDSRFVVLQSIAYTLAGRPEEAAEWARQAAAGPIADQAALRLLVEQCDRLGLFNEALAVLQRAVSDPDVDPATTRALAERLYQVGRFEEVVKLETAEGSEGLQVVRCLALIELKRHEEAGALARKLASPPQAGSADPAAVWKPVLEMLSSGASADTVALARACEAALKLRPRDALLQMVSAEAFAAIGQGREFVRAAQEAAILAPAWSTPLARLAEVSLISGTPGRSLELAGAALQRSPGNARVLYVIAAARTQLAGAGADPALTEARNACDQFEQAAPGDLRTLPLRARLLVAAGDLDEARQVALQAAQASPAPPAGVLLDLANISLAHSLGVEKQCVAACESAWGALPMGLLVKARVLHAGGQKQEAIELLTQAGASAETHSRQTGARSEEYLVLRPQFLEEVGDPAAASAWVQVADANPQNIAIAWRAVNSVAVQQDQEFIGRALARLKQELGDQGLSWRLARARWLLSASSDDTDKAVEAALILNELTREAPSLMGARQLLADALTRLDNLTGAIEQLTIAANLDPSSVSTALSLAGALQKNGETVRAASYARQVLENPEATPAQCREAAELAAAAGDMQAAIRALEQLKSSDGQTELLLASLLARTRQYQKVDEMCERLLAGGDPAAIGFVAAYHQSRGRPELSAAALGKLDELDVAPAAASVIRGDVAMKAGDIESALDHYRRATRSAPVDARAWRSLLWALARSGRLPDFTSTAAEALARSPSDAGLRAASEAARVAASVTMQGPEPGISLGWLLDHPEHADGVRAALDVLAKWQPATPAPLAGLRELADANPQALPVQLIAARVHLEGREPEAAAQLAGRTMRAFPTDSDSARLATLALYACGRWAEVVVAGDAWRERAPAESLVADLVIVNALIQQKDLRAAAARVAGYDLAAVADADLRGRLATQKASVAVLTRDYTAAADLLRPMLAETAQARFAWVMLASKEIVDPQVALAWLNEVAPLVAADGFGQRLAFVDSLLTASQRLNTPELASAAEEARRQLNADAASGALVDGGPLQADHWAALGMLSEKCGDRPTAQGAYLKALELDPRHPVTTNNLAMLIKDTNPDESLRLARIAAAADSGPQRANFMDTLAAVHETRGELEPAIESAQKAAELDPTSASIKLRFARLLIDAGQGPRAEAVLAELEKMAAAQSQASGQLRQEVASLRERLR